MGVDTGADRILALKTEVFGLSNTISSYGNKSGPVRTDAFGCCLNARSSYLDQ